MNIAIIYYRLFDFDGNDQLIGGIETYILNLAELCHEQGWKTLLFQSANCNFENMIGDLKVIGLPIAHLPIPKQKNQLFKAACDAINLKNDLLIFGADHCSVRTESNRCISIQHGISWDLPSKYFTKKKILASGIGAVLKKIRIIRYAIRDFNLCKQRVCVDYNFLNWYRTMMVNKIDGKVWVIPNFSSFTVPIGRISRIHNGSPIKILYARRFTDYRGVKLFADVASELLERYQHIGITFAGEGPEENWLKQKFNNNNRVIITKYYPHESLNVHLEHHIAVVPSIASEGTSLSVAEAMGAGCAIVATAIGGITNMIIDGYNGLLVMPEAESLLVGIESLINSQDRRDQLGRRAYETVEASFNLKVWKQRWLKVIKEVENT